ncbi:MAG: PepSY-like domain-containing protein [Bacteroides sp.]|nr:PepSY-like domain-containing protein [Bacteroides sp.]
MKKIVFLLVTWLAMSVTVLAADGKPITVDRLPQKAQQFIKQYFAGKQVALATVETEFMDKTYEVVFTNGDKVEFDKKGGWTNVDCEHSAVPDDVIPSAIKSYVNKNYPNAKVKQIEKDRKDYDVELTNGWDLKFDKAFRVIELDR